MHKNRLLEELQECIRTEETATAIYLGHLQALTERVGIEQDKVVKKIQAGLNGLIKANNRHRQILEELQKLVISEDRHDW